MKMSHYTEEQIVSKLWEAESSTVTATARQQGLAAQTIYRCRDQFADTEVLDVREIRRLRSEKTRLKKLVAEQVLEDEVMKESQAKE